MTEIWKDVKGYEGIYQVSNLGRVKSLDRFGSDDRKLKGKLIKCGVNVAGYKFVILRKDNDIDKVFSTIQESCKFFGYSKSWLGNYSRKHGNPCNYKGYNITIGDRYV